MGRKERERQARRRAYLAAKGNYWVPSDMSLEAYLQAVSKHPPIAGMLDYIETNLRDSKAVGKMFQFAESRDGSCEKCYVRQIRRDPRSELKAAPQCLNGTADVQFSRYVAEQFAKGKDPIILPPNLHHQFVYSSWVEALHLEHIKDHRDEPGIVALEAHPEIEDGRIGLALSFRAIDGSHRAALAYVEGRPFAVRVLTPVETLKSMFSINNRKNPFFTIEYPENIDEILAQMQAGKIGPDVPPQID